MASKDLGPVTAYAYAKANGYTGTEQQFETLMGSLATDVDNAETMVSKISQMTVDAETGLPGTSADVEFTYGTGSTPAHMHFVIPEGDPGFLANKLYGVKWDRTTNKLTRTRDAVGITTDITNFAHRGTKNANYNNPFDAIYPWSDMFVCNVDLTKYKDQVTSLEDCIISVCGDPDFTYVGTQNMFVGRYRPEFWYKSIEDETGIEFLISQNKRAGFKHSPEAIDGVSFCIDAGDSKITAGSGIPLTNIAVSSIHSRAKSSGFTLQDIFTIDQQIMLYLVEYADMNIQNAIGNGCDSCFRENAADAITSVSTDSTAGTTTIVITDSALSGVIYKGAQVDIGASAGATTYRGLVKDLTVSGSEYTIILDRVLDSVTTGMIASVHGFSACEFDILGQTIGNASGYLGTNDKANAFYRGALLYGNRYSYTLGIYRQTGTNKIWICDGDEDPDDYDALNTAKHTDTGIVLPTAGAAWYTVGDNAQKIPDIEGFLAVGPTSSGSSSSPVGDQQYVPATSTGNTILVFGGVAYAGWNDGGFCGNWYSGAGSSYWDYAGLPILKKKVL